MLCQTKLDLIERHVGYAHALAIKTARALPMMETDEAILLAQEGLVKAAIKIDLSRIKPFLQEHIDTNFRSLAYWKIKGAIIDYCRRSTHHPRGRVSAGRIAYQEVPLSQISPDTLEALDSVMPLEIKVAIARLNERERRIICGTIAGFTNAEMSTQLRISQARVSQILVAARKKIGEEIGYIAA